MAFRFPPGVVDAMDYSEIGSRSKNEEGNGKRSRDPVQERAKNQQNEALGAVPKTDAATFDQGFSASLRVTDHDGSRHHNAGEQSEQETIDRGVVNEEADKNGEVRVAVKDGLKKGTEEIGAGLTMGERSSEKIAGGGRNQDDTGREEPPGGEKNSRDDAKSKTGEGERTGWDTGAVETCDSALENPAKGPAKSADANRHNAGAVRR